MHHLSKAEQLDPLGEVGQAALHDKIVLLVQTENWSQAVKTLKAKQRRFTLTTNDQLLLAQGFEKTGEYRAAARIHQTLSENTALPDQRKHLRLAANLYEQGKDIDSSATLIAREIQRHPDPLHRRMMNYDRLITMATRENQPKTALFWQKKAIASWNEEEAGRTNEGRDIAAKAQYALAVKEINRFKRLKL